jgi:leucyl aminopeptidase (aminopeptidase T)
MNSVQACAEIAINDCLNIRRNEQFLVLCDTFCMHVGRALYDSADGKCKETMLVMVQSRKYDGSALPEIILPVLDKFDCIAIATQKSFSPELIEKLVTEKPVRIATLPGMTDESFCRTMVTDWRKLGIYTRKVAGRAGVAASVRLISGDSAELTFECNGNPARADDGRLMSNGTFGNLPGGEVCLRPKAGTANGTVIVNQSFALADGAMAKPLVVTFRQGIITKIEGHDCLLELEKLFVKNRSGARSLIEFGIGTNDLACYGTTLLEDKKVRGSVHISIGGGDDLPVHLDACIKGASVWIDDKLFVEAGVIC